MAVAPSPSNLLDVITDFLASEPSSEQIIAFRLPDALQEHASELLRRNRDNQLTPDERADMEEFMRLDHFMTILKAKARLKLAGKA